MVTLETLAVAKSLDPLSEINWIKRDVVLKSPDGKIIFEQKDVECPDFWSELSVKIAAHKYFYGNVGEPERETSVRQLIERVAKTITEWGVSQSYFLHVEEAENFYADLCYILIHQIAAFNSPVWFNVGTKEKPTCSACFITEVTDSFESIEELYTTEMEIFRRGSGNGVNLSKLRGSMEKLSKGGFASGPIAFMKGLDFSCGAVKSGGRARRGALMRILNIDHPDIEEFIDLKEHAEAMAHCLIEGGFDPDWEKGIYKDIPWQNANNSVSLTDKFFEAVEGDFEWNLIGRADSKVTAIVQATELFRKLGKAAWTNGCPGVIFHDTINHWNTCLNDGIINASNPCFAGDTYVDTDRGKITIRELAEMDGRGEELPIAFCWDTQTHSAAASRITKAWKTRENAELLEIVTDKGLKFRCTPDHLILVREHLRSSNERYVAAQDLRIGMSLRVWPRGASSEGHVICNDRFTTHYEHILLWEAVNGPVPEGYELHHIDGDMKNNSLSNLQLISITEHRKLHSEGKANAMFGRKRKGEAALVEGSRRRWDNTSDEVKRISIEKRKQTEISKSLDFIKQYNISSKEEYDTLRTQKSAKTSQWMTEQFGTWENVLGEALQANHKVVSVRRVASEDVYDITVERYHNFVISDSPERNGIRDGIVVHNCAEYWFLDNTSCNLASINLLKCVDENCEIDSDLLDKVVRIMITAMDIVVDPCHYPNEKITKHTKQYRTLGLGYANLGALLMKRGLPYDSDKGRLLAAAITAFIHSTAYHQSAELAEIQGPFDRYSANAEHMRRVLTQHRDAIEKPLEQSDNEEIQSLLLAAKFHLTDCIDRPIRNAQATVIAPTGTIGLFMGCDTTGIEPELGLVKYKQIVGGGTEVIINQSVKEALERLGYEEQAVRAIEAYILEKNTVVGSPYLGEKYYSNFATALGDNTISWKGHIKMLAAIQPFLSGSASKTVNVNHSTTVEEIESIYKLAHELGLKCVAIYRDGSKGSQPVTVSKTKTDNKLRHKLPEMCNGHRLKFNLGTNEVYIHTGCFADGRLGEIFITASKSGSTLQGLLNSTAIAISTGLQYGTPLETYVKLLRHQKFEPAGIVKLPGQERPHFYSSVLDVIAHWLDITYLNGAAEISEQSTLASHNDAPMCDDCGSLTTRNGTCYCCPNCGKTTGCS